jgi:hypothetical protein
MGMAHPCGRRKNAAKISTLRPTNVLYLHKSLKSLLIEIGAGRRNASGKGAERRLLAGKRKSKGRKGKPREGKGRRKFPSRGRST